MTPGSPLSLQIIFFLRGRASGSSDCHIWLESASKVCDVAGAPNWRRTVNEAVNTIAQAALEGIAFQVADVLQVMQADAGIR